MLADICLSIACYKFAIRAPLYACSYQQGAQPLIQVKDINAGKSYVVVRVTERSVSSFSKTIIRQPPAFVLTFAF